MADVWANSMACHPRATCHTAGYCHLVNSLSWFQSHMPHCRVQSPGEINVIIPSAILKIVFRHILFLLFFNAVWALTSGSFRIVSDTLVIIVIMWSVLFVCHSVSEQDYWFIRNLAKWIHNILGAIRQTSGSGVTRRQIRIPNWLRFWPWRRFALSEHSLVLSLLSSSSSSLLPRRMRDKRPSCCTII